jgi:hypothetical protein
MSNAVRQRRKCQRRKAGLIVLDVEVHENAFAEALINSGSDARGNGKGRPGRARRRNITLAGLLRGNVTIRLERA